MTLLNPYVSAQHFMIFKVYKYIFQHNMRKYIPPIYTIVFKNKR